MQHTGKNLQWYGFLFKVFSTIQTIYINNKDKLSIKQLKRYSKQTDTPTRKKVTEKGQKQITFNIE